MKLKLSGSITTKTTSTLILLSYLGAISVGAPTRAISVLHNAFTKLTSLSKEAQPLPSERAITLKSRENRGSGRFEELEYEWEATGEAWLSSGSDLLGTALTLQTTSPTGWGRNHRLGQQGSIHTENTLYSMEHFIRLGTLEVDYTFNFDLGTEAATTLLREADRAYAQALAGRNDGFERFTMYVRHEELQILSATYNIVI